MFALAWPRWLLAYAVLFALALALWPGVFLLDDAYITLNNARGVITGHDPVYGVSPLIGATSSVHLLLVALLGMVFPLPLASAIVSSAALVLYAAGLKALAESAGCRGWPVAVIMTTGLLCGYLPLHYYNGLETGLAMAAVAWALALRDSRWLPALCGVMPFIRPELAFLAAPLFIRQISQTRRFFAGVAMAGAAGLFFVLLYLAETGVPFPNTGGAKAVFFAENSGPVFWRLMTALLAIAKSGILPLAIGLVCIRRVPAGWCVAVFVATWLAISAWIMPGSLTHNFFRYLATFVPALCYPLAALLAETRSRKLGLLLIGWTGFGLFLSVPQFPSAIAFTREGLQAAHFVRDRVPAGSTILVHDAGIVAWSQPDARVVDVVGLKTPSSTAAHKEFTTAPCGWGKALDKIARDSAATHLVALQGDPFWECVATGLRDEGWNLTPLRMPQGRGFAIYRIAKSGGV